ncbi:hypothetical protein AAIA72_10705 [Hahella sp. SMD15-11]|uniref:Sigma-70 family RNA polymerase sigma factor n=1 Tax=Thermohahella caldifontis TaxID=3142973 RepID=A0AB39USX8_9GAMM
MTTRNWHDIIRDETGFRDFVNTHLDVLRERIRHELNWHVGSGNLEDGELSVDEVLDELYIRAWADRRRKPADMAPLAWLTGLMTRVVWDLVRQRQASRNSESLEQVIPDDSFIYDDEESFWEWYQPDDVEKLEDELAADQPSVEDVAAALEQRSLPAPARLALALHDLYALALRDVAATMRRELRETWQLVREARRTLGI